MAPKECPTCTILDGGVMWTFGRVPLRSICVTLIDGCEFSWGLNLLDGIVPGRISNTQAVNDKGAVSVVVASDIGVRVVEVVEW